MTEILFAFDASRQSLVLGTGNPQDPIGFIHVKHLEAAGWEPQGRLEVELRKCLPRWDKPVIQVAPASALNGRRR